MSRIILASSSESRKRIFRNTGISFFVKKPKINEKKIKKELKKQKNSIIKITKELAKLKCMSVSKTFKRNMVVGSDTMILCNKKLLDKAINIKDAKNKLRIIAGKKHSIYTSVCVCENKKIIWQHTEKTNVYIKKLKSNEIDYYLRKCGNKILNSVGCYQAEKMGPHIFSKIDGDFYNVLGFPIIPFINFLNKNTNIK